MCGDRFRHKPTFPAERSFSYWSRNIFGGLSVERSKEETGRKEGCGRLYQWSLFRPRCLLPGEGRGACQGQSRETGGQGGGRGVTWAQGTRVECRAPSPTLSRSPGPGETCSPFSGSRLSSPRDRGPCLETGSRNRAQGEGPRDLPRELFIFPRCCSHLCALASAGSHLAACQSHLIIFISPPLILLFKKHCSFLPFSSSVLLIIGLRVKRYPQAHANTRIVCFRFFFWILFRICHCLSCVLVWFCFSSCFGLLLQNVPLRFPQRLSPTRSIIIKSIDKPD